MKNRRFSLLLLAGFILFPLFSRAQESDPPSSEDKVKDIIGFLEYMLNTLGDQATSARDKDVIVTESYKKVFRDGQVQIEDDLDENRDVVTNKDVTAYLKDVNFFFKHVKFDFEIQDIESDLNENDQQFFKVTLQRNLSGVTIDGDTVNQTIPRYIEINLNPKDRDLRIVSIYTHELNVNEAWKNWWEDLSLEWKNIFRDQVEGGDIMTLDKIKSLASLQSLDLSNNQYVIDVRPLSRITGLQKLNISNTSVEDISPIRNLNKLEELDVSHTPVTEIGFLKYDQSMRVLNISYTQVRDLAVLGRMPALEVLEMENVPVNDFDPLAKASKLQVVNSAYTSLVSFNILTDLTALQVLDLSGTTLTDLNNLPALPELRQLYLDSTIISNLSPLQKFKNLQLLSINHTPVKTIDPLLELPSINRIYCDGTGVTREQAVAFTTKNANALVIFQTEDLTVWWSQLPVAWKDIFEKHLPAAENPTRESLAAVTRLDSLNITGNVYVQDLAPLNRLLNLKKLQVSETAINDLSALSAMRDLTYLDLSHTSVNTLEPIKNLMKLEVIRANNTLVDDISPIRNLPNLKLLQIDETTVADTAAIGLARAKPSALILFKTDILTTWWGQLSADWKTIFRQSLKITGEPDAMQLHELISSESISLNETGIYNLNPLTEFIRLKKLEVNGNRISNLGPLSALPTLQELYLSRNPLEDLEPISMLLSLRKLDISNTPVEDLDFVEGLGEMRYLNCSGTQIKRLDPLDGLRQLEYLDCSNTSVKRLDPVTGLAIKTLKCYNTRVSDGRIEDFKQFNPEASVSYY